jgi:hypothetical protein
MKRAMKRAMKREAAERAAGRAAREYWSQYRRETYIPRRTHDPLGIEYPSPADVGMVEPLPDSGSTYHQT